MKRPVSLEKELEAQFFRYVESIGFIRDKRREPLTVCFRRRTEDTLQILDVRWKGRNFSTFWILFAEAPLNGIDWQGKHISAEEILPTLVALPHGWIFLEKGKIYFRHSPPWRCSFIQQQHDASTIVQKLLDIFPEVLAWWEKKIKGSHLVIMAPVTPPKQPDHKSVIGHFLRPSWLQFILANDLISFIGLAVAADIVMALDLKIHLPIKGSLLIFYFLFFPGAALGLVVGAALFVILRPIRIRINGGPFYEGDLVQVIAGPYAGKIAIVYEEWPSRGQVRINLGKLEWQQVTDVFEHVKLLKVKT